MAQPKEHVYGRLTVNSMEPVEIGVHKHKGSKHSYGIVKHTGIGEFTATRVTREGAKISEKIFDKGTKILVNERETLRMAIRWVVDGFDSMIPADTSDKELKVALKLIME